MIQGITREQQHAAIYALGFTEADLSSITEVLIEPRKITVKTFEYERPGRIKTYKDTDGQTCAVITTREFTIEP